MIIFGGEPKPEYPGYIGPRETYERYVRGEVVTQTDVLCDQSEFIMVTDFPNHDRDRLWWMVEHLETVDGKPQRIKRAGGR